LIRRLSRAGFKKDFVRSSLLPDWWDESCEENPALLPEIEIRLARFLGLPVSVLQDPTHVLARPDYPGAQLRRTRNLDRKRLGPAIHAALQIASAVVRALKPTASLLGIPPSDGLRWREQIRRKGPHLDLKDIAADLWERGVPVVPLDMLPAPSFQGLACTVEGRPVVLLGQRRNEPGRAAFFIAHEVGHIAAGDCTPGHPVVDEDDEIADDAQIEVAADRYATRALAGGDEVPIVNAADYRTLALQAGRLEREQGIDASAVIFAWARRTGDYAQASLSVKALYKAAGARHFLREYFDRNVDLESASETDRGLLRCVYGDPDRNATAA
jgi:hypothetical protein